VAAYEHVSMIKLHYSIANALNECAARMQAGQANTAKDSPGDTNGLSAFDYNDEWIDL
jgi:hypothetical protein